MYKECDNYGYVKDHNDEYKCGYYLSKVNSHFNDPSNYGCYSHYETSKNHIRDDTYDHHKGERMWVP